MSSSEQAEDLERANELMRALDEYRPARQALLATLGLSASNRDPLAEFSEQLVHALLGGVLARSRVQAGHDLVQVDGRKVQVRYLANPSSGPWINEHRVHRIPGVELYALVLFEAFDVVGVLVFALDRLAEICAALCKRHPDQHDQLQLTRRNWQAIRDDPKTFEALGVRVRLPPLASIGRRGC
jgi:hypothetical protein